jgi:hypothetical protein
MSGTGTTDSKQEALGMSLDDLIKQQNKKKTSSRDHSQGRSGSGKGGRNRKKNTKSDHGGGRDAMKTDQVFRVRNDSGAHKRRGDRGRHHSRDDRDGREESRYTRDYRRGYDRDGREAHRQTGRSDSNGKQPGPQQGFVPDPYMMMTMLSQQFMGAGRRGGRGGRGRGRGGRGRGRSSQESQQSHANVFSKDGLERQTCAFNSEGVLGIAFDGTNVVLIAPTGDVSISLMRTLSEADTHLMLNSLNWTLHSIGIELIVKDLAQGELQVKVGRSLVRYSDGMVVEGKGQTTRAEKVMEAVQVGKEQ